MYPTHEDYYKDKRFIVFDKNFNQSEEYLLNQFKSAIDSAFDFTSNKNLERVEDFKKEKVNLKDMDLQNNAPFIHPGAVATSIKYDDLQKNDPNMKVISSDPYGTMFGGHMK